MKLFIVKNPLALIGYLLVRAESQETAVNKAQDHFKRQLDDDERLYAKVSSVELDVQEVTFDENGIYGALEYLE